MTNENQAKVALITGAAGNLGAAVAQAFAKSGYSLALVDLNAEGLEQTKNSIDAPTIDIRVYPTDLISPDSVSKQFTQIQQDFSRIDVLANIAGGFTMGPTLHETSDRDWNFMFDLNARTMFNSCRATIPFLLDQQGGRIISVSARAAAAGKAKMAPYCASKAAVITLTESLAAEHKFNNINVNCILPGTIDTPQNRKDMPDADFSTWVAPSQLADVILFLASDNASAVTGAAIPVYGKS